MTHVDVLGFVAAALVLLTFFMTSMRALRLSALLSNLAFLGYGYLADLTPVLALHALLIPLNLWRFLQIDGEGRCARLSVVGSRPRS